MAEQLDNYYSILDIEMGESPETIEAAIKAARKRWRQMQGSPDKERARLAEQRMEQLEAAGNILLDAAKRHEYDAALKRQLTEAVTQPAPATTNWGERAKEYYENGDVRNAFNAAKKGTDVDSENAISWLYYVLSAIDLKRMDDADFASAELVNRVPNAHTSHDLRGSVLDTMNRFAEAEISFRAAANLEPSSAYYHGRAAWAMLDQGRIDEATREAKDIAARFPGEDYPFRVLRAATDALRENHRPAEALALARELLTTSLRNDEDLILNAILSVQDIEKAGDIGTAATEAWALLDMFPSNQKVQRLARYVVYSMREKNLVAEVLEWSQALLQRFPHDQEMKALRAKALMDDAEAKMAQTAPGKYSIFNKAQAAYMAARLQEIEALQLTDHETLSQLQNKRAFLASQTKTQIQLSFAKVILAIVAVVLVLFIGIPNLPGGFFFIIIGGLLGWWFWVISFPKQYRLNAKQSTPEIRKTGLQK